MLPTLPPILLKLATVYSTSNGNASETKANESFDNGVFFDIEAKRTPSIVSKLFSKRSEHIRKNENYFRSEANKFESKTTVFKAKANMSDSKKIIFEAKRTHYIERKLFSKRSEHISDNLTKFIWVKNYTKTYKK